MQEPILGKSNTILSNLQQGLSLSAEETDYITKIIRQLDVGKLRVCTQDGENWVTHTWIKESILAYFLLQTAEQIKTDIGIYRDKVPVNKHNYEQLQDQKIRTLPPAQIRYGSFISEGCILMPSFVNIGAFIGKNTMIDTWASIGSCAQIGANVHISAGTGIGGVLEPSQATPTIIEDNCFVGGRCEISEGVVIKKGAVIASGTSISQSTKIYSRINNTITYGCIPENAVVVPGSIPSEDKKYSIAAAIIVKFADTQTKAKVSINQLLREI